MGDAWREYRATVSQNSEFEDSWSEDSVLRRQEHRVCVGVSVGSILDSTVTMIVDMCRGLLHAGLCAQHIAHLIASLPQ